MAVSKAELAGRYGLKTELRRGPGCELLNPKAVQREVEKEIEAGRKDTLIFVFLGNGDRTQCSHFRRFW